jgi:hypothetical protein
MINCYKYKIENLKNQKETLWLVMSFDKNQKDIWNKTFHFYLTNEELESDVELLRFISYKTLSKLWKLANKNLAMALEAFEKGGSFPLATICNGKFVDLNK